MNFLRYLLALVIALGAAISLQLFLTMFDVCFVMSGMDLELESLSKHLFGNNVLSFGLAYLMETLVAFGGIFPAAIVLPSRHRGVGCFIITFICLVVSQLPLIPLHHHQLNHGWLYIVFTDPLLYCFALGGFSCSIFFSVKHNEERLVP